METKRRCPDCGVAMEETTLRTGGGHRIQAVSDESRGGILGVFGVNERHDVEGDVRP